MNPSPDPRGGPTRGGEAGLARTPGPGRVGAPGSTDRREITTPDAPDQPDRNGDLTRVGAGDRGIDR